MRTLHSFTNYSKLNQVTKNQLLSFYLTLCHFLDQYLVVVDCLSLENLTIINFMCKQNLMNH